MWWLPCRHGIELNKNWLKDFRIPNHHLFPPPFELKLNKTNANSPIKSGMEIIVNGILLKSPSNRSANNTWYTKIGITVSEFPIAELIAVRRWACDTSGVRNNIPQNITLYKTPIKSYFFSLCSICHSGFLTQCNIFEVFDFKLIFDSHSWKY